MVLFASVGFPDGRSRSKRGAVIRQRMQELSANNFCAHPTDEKKKTSPGTLTSAVTVISFRP